MLLNAFCYVRRFTVGLTGSKTKLNNEILIILISSWTIN